MSKTITLERLLKTTERFNERSNQKIEKDSAIVKSAFLLGFKTASGVATELDHQKLGLELDFAGCAKEQEDIEAVFDRWHEAREKISNRRDWINNIQRKHGISGLKPITVKISETKSLETFWDDDRLVLIESDLDVLRGEKVKVFDAWVERAHSNGVSDFYWMKDEEWEPVEFSQIEQVSRIPLYDWAHMHESCWYTSPSKLRNEGFDRMRSTPEIFDDEKRHEIHLWLGNGVYTDNPEISISLCACNREPSY
jgi:hypothetical protein